MVRLITLLVACAFVLSGCESPSNSSDSKTARHQRQADDWRQIEDIFIGAPESDLVNQMGPPEEVYTTSDGTRVLSYEWGRTIETTGKVRGRDRDRYTSATTLKECDLVVSVQEGVVKSMDFRGNWCPQF